MVYPLRGGDGEMGKADKGQLNLQVIERLKKDIESGILNEHIRFPREYELARNFGVSREVMREALQVLEDENVIVRKQGFGLYVNPKPLFTSGIEELTSISTMIHKAGMEPGTIFLDVSNEQPSDDTISHFDFTEEDSFVKIKRIRTANGEPVVYCVDNVLAKNFPVGTEELLNMSIFEAIELTGKIRIVHAIAHIEPIGYDDDVSSILRCGVDVPLLVLKQQHFSADGEMVLYSRNYFRADKFSFHVVRKRV